MKNYGYGILILCGLFYLSSCQERPSSVADRDPTVKTWAFPYFEKVDSLNPILTPEEDQQFRDPITDRIVDWEARNVLNPTAVVRNDSVFYSIGLRMLRGLPGLVWRSVQMGCIL